MKGYLLLSFRFLLFINQIFWINIWMSGTHCCVQFNDKAWFSDAHSVVLHHVSTETQIYLTAYIIYSVYM